MSVDKKPWSQYVNFTQEDDSLKSLIDELGPELQWRQVAKLMKEKCGINKRSGKQCRERWNNHLDPNTRKREWTQEEDMIIFNYQQREGNQWSKISKFLVGRSDNTIKNHFYATIRRKLRKYNRLHEEKISKPLSEIMEDRLMVKLLMEIPEKEKKIACTEPRRSARLLSREKLMHSDDEFYEEKKIMNQSENRIDLNDRESGEPYKIYMPSPIKEKNSNSFDSSSLLDDNFGSFSCFLQLSNQGLPCKPLPHTPNGSFEIVADSTFQAAQNVDANKVCGSFKLYAADNTSEPFPNYSPTSSFQFARFQNL